MKLNLPELYSLGRPSLSRAGIFTWLRFLFVYIDFWKICGAKQRLLDVACGDSSFLIWLTKHIDYVGLDLDRTKLKSNKLAHPSLDLILGDASNLPFTSDSFDIVITSETLEHLDSRSRYYAIRDISRTSSNHVIVTVPTIGFLNFFAVYVYHFLQSLRLIQAKNRLFFKSSSRYFPSFVKRGLTPFSKRTVSSLLIYFEIAMAQLHFPFGQYLVMHFQKNHDVLP
jgi:ubiquinone/menaquinone biosynthesis C-methylase UbiE